MVVVVMLQMLDLRQVLEVQLFYHFHLLAKDINGHTGSVLGCTYSMVHENSRVPPCKISSYRQAAQRPTNAIDQLI